MRTRFALPDDSPYLAPGEPPVPALVPMVRWTIFT